MASRWQADNHLVFAEPLSPLSSSTGEPLRRGALMHRYGRALKAAQLEPTHRFHDLRHTVGTAMAGASVPMRTQQKWMGHRDISTTQRYADHAPNPHEVEMAEAAFHVSSDRSSDRSARISGDLTALSASPGGLPDLT